MAGFFIGLVGIVLTVYYARKAEDLNRRRKRLEWPDLQAAANDLARKMKPDVAPVALVTPGLTGATFANLLVAEFSKQPPVYVGTRIWKDDPHFPQQDEDAIVIETKKWLVTVPRVVTRIANGTVLIVDDFVMSGDFLDALKKELVQAGIVADRIRSCSIVTTKVAIKNHKAPDYYWWMADDDEFFFPWGKAQ